MMKMFIPTGWRDGMKNSVGMRDAGLKRSSLDTLLCTALFILLFYP